MAQGAAKLKAGGKAGASGGAKKRVLGKTAKGKRVIPPKDKQRVAEKAQQKKLSSSINSSIEKQMVQAASTGKLTIMKGSQALPAGKGKDKAK